MSNEKNKVKSFLLFFFKLAIAVGIVWYLLRCCDREKLISCFENIHPGILLLAFTVYISHMFVCAWRWWVLANILNIKLSCFEAISLTFQGYFFSLVIPGGALGGDVVKMGVISKRSKSGEKLEGAFTVLMDRIIGLISLFVLTLVLLPFAAPILMNINIPHLAHSADMKKLLIAGIALLCIAGLSASCVIFFHKQLRKIGFFSKLMDLGDKITHGMVNRMTSATDIYSRSWKKLAVLTLIGIPFVHLMTVVPVCILFAGLGIQFDILTVVAAITLGNIAGLIPLFPAGVGGRDLTAIAIMTAGGIPLADATAVQIVYTAMILVANLASGLFFVFDRGRKQELEENNNV